MLVVGGIGGGFGGDGGFGNGGGVRGLHKDGDIDEDVIHRIKANGRSGTKSPESYVTRVPQNLKGSIGRRFNIRCCMSQNVGQLKGTISNN